MQGAADITGLYTARYGVPPVGKKVYVRVNQFVDGWESLPTDFWAIVPADGLTSSKVAQASRLRVHRPSPPGEPSGLGAGRIPTQGLPSGPASSGRPPALYAAF